MIWILNGAHISRYKVICFHDLDGNEKQLEILSSICYWKLVEFWLLFF